MNTKYFFTFSLLVFSSVACGSEIELFTTKPGSDQVYFRLVKKNKKNNSSIPTANILDVGDKRLVFTAQYGNKMIREEIQQEISFVKKGIAQALVSGQLNQYCLRRILGDERLDFELDPSNITCTFDLDLTNDGTFVKNVATINALEPSSKSVDREKPELMQKLDTTNFGKPQSTWRAFIVPVGCITLFLGALVACFQFLKK